MTDITIDPTVLTVMQAEEEARTHIKEAARHWYEAARLIQWLRADNRYKITNPAMTWSVYCDQVLGISDSRARQWFSAVRLQDELAPHGILLDNESQARALLASVPDDVSAVQVYKVAKEAAQLMHQDTPTGLHFKAAVNVLQEAQTTGYADFGDGRHAPLTPESVVLATIDEVKARYAETQARVSASAQIVWDDARQAYIAVFNDTPITGVVTIYGKKGE